jgi:urease accessory protein
MGGVDHILAMFAVGVFAAVLGGRALLLIPMSFIGMMTVGFLLGMEQVGLPFVELGIALSSVVIAGAAALNRPMPVVAAMTLVGVFAVFHGHAHGAEMPASVAGLNYAAGFLLATALLHAAGALLTILAAKALKSRLATTGRWAAVPVALGGVAVLTGWL